MPSAHRMLGRQTESARVSGAWDTWDWIAMVAITAAAAALRGVRLGLPDVFIFDEVHYAREACWYTFGASVCGFPLGHLEGHPPLGKWLIAIGIRLFGYTPLGWRTASFVAGTLTVALVYLLARRLLLSRWGAAVAAGLLAIEPLHFIHSRIAMLDIFVALFAVCAILCAVYDRDQIASGPRAGPRGGLAGVLPPWRMAAGAAVGAAIASKWTAAPLVAAVIFLTGLWLVSAYPRGSGGTSRRVLREHGASLVICLLVLPAIVYMATWVGRLPGSVLAWPWAEESWLRALVREQGAFIEYYTRPRLHPTSSPAWDWLLLKRPVVYYLQFEELTYRLVVGFGNPFIWWASMIALGVLAVKSLRGPSPAAEETIIVVAAAFTFGPWLVMSAFKPPVPWYMLTTIPFMCLALGWAAARCAHTRWGRAGIVTWTLAAVAVFGFLYPLLTAAVVPYASWRGHGPTLTDCEILQHLPLERLSQWRSC